MKKLLATLFATLMCAICAIGMAGCGTGARDLDDILKSGYITVATNAEFAPFESKEGENYVGIDIEIAQKIADSLGVTLRINNMDFDSVVTSVQKGQSDLALAALTINETRKKAIDFSEAYCGAAQYLIVRSADNTFDACTTKEDVEEIISAMPSGTKATAQEGTTGYFYVKGSEAFEYEGFSNINATSFKTANDAAQDVVNGNAAFAVVDDEVARQIVSVMQGVKVIEIALSNEQYGIGINKGNTALKWFVDSVITEMKLSGEINEIIARHTAE